MSPRGRNGTVKRHRGQQIAAEMEPKGTRGTGTGTSFIEGTEPEKANRTEPNQIPPGREPGAEEREHRGVQPFIYRGETGGKGVKFSEIFTPGAGGYQISTAYRSGDRRTVTRKFSRKSKGKAEIFQNYRRA